VSKREGRSQPSCFSFLCETLKKCFAKRLSVFEPKYEQKLLKHSSKYYLLNSTEESKSGLKQHDSKYRYDDDFTDKTKLNEV